jgi:hypothetical protein
METEISDASLLAKTKHKFFPVFIWAEAFLAGFAADILQSYCANKSKKPANKSSEFTFGPILSTPPLQELFDLLEGKTIPPKRRKWCSRLFGRSPMETA